MSSITAKIRKAKGGRSCQGLTESTLNNEELNIIYLKVILQTQCQEANK